MVVVGCQICTLDHMTSRVKLGSIAQRASLCECHQAENGMTGCRDSHFCGLAIWISIVVREDIACALCDRGRCWQQDDDNKCSNQLPGHRYCIEEAECARPKHVEQCLTRQDCCRAQLNINQGRWGSRFMAYFVRWWLVCSLAANCCSFQMTSTIVRKAKRACEGTPTQAEHAPA